MNLKFAIVENVYWLNIGNITTKISKKKGIPHTDSKL